MAARIGFSMGTDAKQQQEVIGEQVRCNEGKRSLVQVYFEEKSLTLTYYNDRFALQRGDTVFVSGKLAGHSGRVTEVCYSFKIRPSDYERVISVADTEVHGSFFAAGSLFATMEEASLPPIQAKSWFFPIGTEAEEFITESDGNSFPLEDLRQMGVSEAVAERGHGYYMENRVRYLHLKNGKGYAIVQGNKPYEVEFGYSEGEITDPVCTCFCNSRCKHTFAAMLQLKELFHNLGQERAQAVQNGKSVSAMQKMTFLAQAVMGHDDLRFSL